ncbi:hypothetical protein EPA93_10215 [Ktedonosporobacter rubrisoli]|uniref:DUF2269 family protein n=1 Tax=Ktedonosporobacter rubrisoli TaxID=2509675 RepID=A0A4P6JMU9_KTERU|nr:hypothetical protein [Ktedonosporobacter rubrisoli]QBD76362.1 hypothetical protein EPA93_10215 [Ktedonosporobacter rubrisoli]
MDDKQLLLATLQEDWKHAHKAEDKRHIIAALNLILATACQIALALLGFSPRLLPLTLWLIIIGIYGIAASSKLYERSQYHNMRAKEVRGQLDPESVVNQSYQAAEEKHRKHYPVLMHIRLNNIWLGMHVVVALLGLIYTVLCLRGA